MSSYPPTDAASTRDSGLDIPRLIGEILADLGCTHIDGGLAVEDGVDTFVVTHDGQIVDIERTFLLEHGIIDGLTLLAPAICDVIASRSY